MLEPARPRADTHCGARAGRLHGQREANASCLENDYGVARAYELFHARGVPVGEANATVARSAANRLRIIRAVNTDPGLIQTDP